MCKIGNVGMTILETSSQMHIGTYIVPIFHQKWVYFQRKNTQHASQILAILMCTAVGRQTKEAATYLRNCKADAAVRSTLTANRLKWPRSSEVFSAWLVRFCRLMMISLLSLRCSAFCPVCR